MDTFPKCSSAWLSMSSSRLGVSRILSFGKGACALEGDVPLDMLWLCQIEIESLPKIHFLQLCSFLCPAQARSQCHCTLLFALAGEGCAGSCPFSPGWPRNQGWKRKRRRCCGCSAQPFSGWLPLYSSGRWQGKVPWGFRSLQPALSGTG